jgi:hypothetical protein
MPKSSAMVIPKAFAILLMAWYYGEVPSLQAGKSPLIFLPANLGAAFLRGYSHYRAFDFQNSMIPPLDKTPIFAVI